MANVSLVGVLTAWTQYRIWSACCQDSFPLSIFQISVLLLFWSLQLILYFFVLCFRKIKKPVQVSAETSLLFIFVQTPTTPTVPHHHPQQTTACTRPLLVSTRCQWLNCFRSWLKVAVLWIPASQSAAESNRIMWQIPAVDAKSRSGWNAS